jgi:hypothetical protein
MTINKALKTITEAVESGGIKDLKRALIKPLKEAYGVGSLAFWKDQAGWHYCGFKQLTYRDRHDFHLLENDNLDDLLYLLKSLKNNQGTVFFGTTRFNSLDDLKQEMLIRKLSGIE